MEENVPLRSYSTFRIGGPASYFAEARSVGELQALISSWFPRPLLIVGKGSNCLFDDRGFDGLVILNKIAHCVMQEGTISVGAGFSFSLLGAQTARKGYAGLEFASGIPGSVGGAIFMNAGANGQETKETLMRVEVVTKEGKLRTFHREELRFAYRYSSFQENDCIIVGATFALTKAPEARQKQLGFIRYRTETQPYDDPSIGCVFRNPPGKSAGSMIEICGLKGARIGGAIVSEKHANFIVNRGDARAEDVLALMAHVEKVVFEKQGILLEREIRYIPYRLM